MQYHSLFKTHEVKGIIYVKCQFERQSTNLLGAILMSVKLSNVAHPVSVVAAGVSPQPTSDASIDTASSMATSSGSNARDHAGKQIHHMF